MAGKECMGVCIGCVVGLQPTAFCTALCFPCAGSMLPPRPTPPPPPPPPPPSFGMVLYELLHRKMVVADLMYLGSAAEAEAFAFKVSRWSMHCVQCTACRPVVAACRQLESSCLCYQAGTWLDACMAVCTPQMHPALSPPALPCPPTGGCRLPLPHQPRAARQPAPARVRLPGRRLRPAPQVRAGRCDAVVACNSIAISGGCGLVLLAAGTAPHSKHVCKLTAHPASLPAAAWLRWPGGWRRCSSLGSCRSTSTGTAPPPAPAAAPSCEAAGRRSRPFPTWLLLSPAEPVP